MLRRILGHPYFIWTLLAVPSLPMIVALIMATPGTDGTSVTKMLLHPTGEFKA